MSPCSWAEHLPYSAEIPQDWNGSPAGGTIAFALTTSVLGIILIAGIITAVVIWRVKRLKGSNGAGVSYHHVEE